MISSISKQIDKRKISLPLFGVEKKLQQSTMTHDRGAECIYIPLWRFSVHYPTIASLVCYFSCSKGTHTFSFFFVLAGELHANEEVGSRLGLSFPEPWKSYHQVSLLNHFPLSLCVCVCVCEREREREREISCLKEIKE